MLGRLAKTGGYDVARASPSYVANQTRNAQSMKIVKERMRSVTNIMKITKAMKMVAAAKMKHDQRRMDNGMPFVKPVQRLLERVAHEEKAVGSITYLAITGDKGLCGGVNSVVSKLTRLGIQEEEAKGNQAKIMVVGGKGLNTLKRVMADRFTNSFEESGKLAFTFGTASLIAERVINSDPNRLKIVSNTFRSMVAYDTDAKSTVTMKEVKSMDKAEWSKAMDVYSFEPSLYEVWDDLHEFYYGSAIFGACLQAATTEQSSRMTAMENASKNAGEMLEKLSLIYNRARQAKITTELCEIISGAAAV